MTAQSKVGSLVASLRSTAATCWGFARDLTIVAVFLIGCLFLLMPIGRAVFDYWHSTIAAWQPAPAAKVAPAIKRAQP